MAQSSSPNSPTSNLVLEIESSVKNRLDFRSRWPELLKQARRIQPPVAPIHTLIFGKDAEINFNLMTH